MELPSPFAHTVFDNPSMLRRLKVALKDAYGDNFPNFSLPIYTQNDRGDITLFLPMMCQNLFLDYNYNISRKSYSVCITMGRSSANCYISSAVWGKKEREREKGGERVLSRKSIACGMIR